MRSSREQCHTQTSVRGSTRAHFFSACESDSSLLLEGVGLIDLIRTHSIQREGTFHPVQVVCQLQSCSMSPSHTRTRRRTHTHALLWRSCCTMLANGTCDMFYVLLLPKSTFLLNRHRATSAFLPKLFGAERDVAWPRHGHLTLHVQLAGPFADHTDFATAVSLAPRRSSCPSQSS